jgi:hypothetical protein
LNFGAGASVTTGATGAAGASVAAAGGWVGAGAGWHAANSIDKTAIIDIRLNSSLLFMVSFLLRIFIELVRLVGNFNLSRN